jgi:hypothetical protein
MQEIYSKELLDLIEEYASNLLTIDEIAILVDMDEDQLRDEIQDKASQISKAYYKAKTLTVLAIRRQEVELAKVGSPMAVEHAAQFITDMDISENA